MSNVVIRPEPGREASEHKSPTTARKFVGFLSFGKNQLRQVMMIVRLQKIIFFMFNVLITMMIMDISIITREMPLLWLPTNRVISGEVPGVLVTVAQAGIIQIGKISHFDFA